MIASKQKFLELLDVMEAVEEDIPTATRVFASTMIQLLRTAQDRAETLEFLLERNRQNLS